MPALPKAKAGDLSWSPYGPNAFILRLGNQGDEATFHRVHHLVEALTASPPPGMADVIPGFASVTVELQGNATQPIAELALRLLEQVHAFEAHNTPAPERRTLTIPVSYDGPDLDHVAAHTSLSKAEVIQRHQAATYRVHLIGFCPGFPYLQGMDPKLNTPRLSAPRSKVAVGSVAIGGEHTGIYSVERPGGWNLIGRTETRLFDAAQAVGNAPAASIFLCPGDLIRFVQV